MYIDYTAVILFAYSRCPEHHLSHHLLVARLLVSCAPTCIWTELWGFTEDYIWKRSHWCIRYQAALCLAFEKRRACWKKDEMYVYVCVCVCIRQSTVHQQSALRLPAAWCGDWDATCQKVRGLAEWLHITLSAPATSHLYCDANPWPVPDGAFPASWVHRNMIIYPKHFSSL